MASVDLITTAYYKVSVEKTAGDRDAVISQTITQASQAISRRYERELTPRVAAATRRIIWTPRGHERIIDLAPYDLRAATSVTVNPGATDSAALVAGTDYVPCWYSAATGTYLGIQLSRHRTVSSARLLQFGSMEVDVLGDWGAWLLPDFSPPEDVQRACVITVGSWLDRAIAEYGVSAFDEGRGLPPAAAGTWAIPLAAHTLLVGAQVPRMTAV